MRPRVSCCGLRYAAALSLEPSLHAGEVPAADIHPAIAALTEALRFYTPDVEPSNEEPGIFWLGASGLSLLYPSLRKWASWVGDEVARAGFRAAIVVGFSRFGTYALARSDPRPRADVVDTESEEKVLANLVALNRLGVAPDVRETLAKLGVATLGDFLALPANGIRTRFGEEAHRLHRVASGTLAAPLQPRPAREPVASTVHLDYAEADLERLMAVIDRSIQALVRTLDERGEVLRAIVIQLEFDDHTKTAERLEPASPTLDLSQIIELVRLRLTGVLAARAAVASTRAHHLRVGSASLTQPDLFDKTPRAMRPPPARRASAPGWVRLGGRRYARRPFTRGTLRLEPVASLSTPPARGATTAARAPHLRPADSFFAQPPSRRGSGAPEAHRRRHGARNLRALYRRRGMVGARGAARVLLRPHVDRSRIVDVLRPASDGLVHSRRSRIDAGPIARGFERHTHVAKPV
jgi:hypothetical protein